MRRPIALVAFVVAGSGLRLPTLPGATTAPPLLTTMRADVGSMELDWLDVATRNHIPFNSAGVPGLCMPCGLADGLPVSLQLVGRPHDEGLLLAVGVAYQEATTHHLVPPTVLEAVAA